MSVSHDSTGFTLVHASMVSAFNARGETRTAASRRGADQDECDKDRQSAADHEGLSRTEQPAGYAVGNQGRAPTTVLTTTPDRPWWARA